MVQKYPYFYNNEKPTYTQKKYLQVKPTLHGWSNNAEDEYTPITPILYPIRIIYQITHSYNIISKKQIVIVIKLTYFNLLQRFKQIKLKIIYNFLTSAPTSVTVHACAKSLLQQPNLNTFWRRPIFNWEKQQTYIIL